MTPSVLLFSKPSNDWMDDGTVGATYLLIEIYKNLNFLGNLLLGNTVTSKL
jgi:hypothetical protein